MQVVEEQVVEEGGGGACHHCQGLQQVVSHAVQVHGALGLRCRHYLHGCPAHSRRACCEQHNSVAYSVGWLVSTYSVQCECAIYTVQREVCNIQCAAYNATVQHIVGNMQFAAYSVQQYRYNEAVQHTVQPTVQHTMQHTVCSIQFSIQCSIQCAAYNAASAQQTTQHTMQQYSIQCATYSTAYNAAYSVQQYRYNAIAVQYSSAIQHTVCVLQHVMHGLCQDL